MKWGKLSVGDRVRAIKHECICNGRPEHECCERRLNMTGEILRISDDPIRVKENRIYYVKFEDTSVCGRSEDTLELL